MRNGLEEPMIRRIVGLPVRVLKRALDTLDGERGAPSPAPPMAPVVTKPTAKPAAAASEPAQAKPKSKAPAKAASKKKKASKSGISVDPQETPNPNAMKFTLSVKVAETGSFSFNAEDTDIEHAIAAAIVAVDGVVSVFGVNDFVTVSKADSADWNQLLPLVVDAIKGAA